jgi:hypothetical protein
VTQDQWHVPPPATAGPQQRLVVNRYEIVSEIGRGGMGIVWLAEDRMIGRRVAIKELHLAEGVPASERAVFQERVLREARTAGRLNDPAVVTVYDVVQESGNTFIVMELIEAPTLSDIVGHRGPLPQDAVASLASQLLSALEAAHTAGIVHRDVKPSNIMVLPNGRVKLTDFGIAQALDDPRLTTSGILIGSPTYMAPERIQGGEADAASDLWALGAVLYFAVEGSSPFERSSTAATMHAIMTEVPYLTRCQGPLASVIMGLLVNSPQGRLTAAQVRGLLAQLSVLPGPSPQAVAPAGTVQYPGRHATMVAPGGPLIHRRLSPGRRWVAAVAAVLMVGGVFAGGWYGKALLTADKPPPRPGGEANGGTMTYGTGGDFAEFTLSSGDCGGAPLAAGRSFTSGTDCDKPHDFEVLGYHEPFWHDYDEQGGYPGVAALAGFAETWCAMTFASEWVRPADKHTTLSFVAVVPTEQLWDVEEEYNRRMVGCLVRKRDGSQLPESVIAE